jgi:hypothetical protein
MEKIKSIALILLGIAGATGVLIYKSHRDTLTLIGPKSGLAFILCGILIIIGIKLLEKKKKQ